MKLTENKIFAILKKHGYKMTPQRQAILNIIATTSGHLTPAEIYSKAHQVHPSVSLVTTYRTLDILSELDLLCKVHSEKACHNYVLRKPVEHHHHLICSTCGIVQDFSNCDLRELEEKLSKETGFHISGHLLEFHGYCPNCRQEAKSKILK